MLELRRLIIETAESGLNLQTENGSFPAGHNGPYNDNDTPVRNTAHWAITMFDAYERSGRDDFLQSGRKALAYLCNEKKRSGNVTFRHRKNTTQDRANGLVGQAWTIEALATGLNTIDDKRIFDIASDVFLSHPFNDTTGMWRIVDVDGSVMKYDTTFNHQLWFAMSGGILSSVDQYSSTDKSKQIRRQVMIFLDKLNNSLRLSPSGYVIHPLMPSPPKCYIQNIQKNREFQEEIFYKWIRVLYGKSRQCLLSDHTNIMRKSPPYHSFNAYALAVLQSYFPDHSFWNTSKYKRIYQKTLDPKYIERIEGDKYAYGYNPPGLELPYFWYIYEGKVSTKAKKLIKRQLLHSYDFENNRMEKRTDDKLTHMARFYEITRMPNLKINISSDHV